MPDLLALVNALEVERIIIGSSLAVGAYITFTCPCGTSDGRGLLSCHMIEISTLIGIATATIIYANR